ncbi:flagellar biosynthetic protein FliR [bacterium]|nr:flagellar biosynthetic protein FliR [bacterium]
MPTDLLILLSPVNIILFVLVLTRLGGLMTSAPIFSTFPVPPQVKIWFVVFVSFIMFPMVQSKTSLSVPPDMITLTVLLLKEFMIGYIVGFIANIVFISVQIAAELISIQSGLSSAQALNPLSGESTSVLSSLYMIFASFVFIALNAQQWLFASIYRSFQTVPPGYSFIFSGQLVQNIVSLTGQMFTIGIGIALPIFSVLLITDVLLAFTSKVMPQMNVFMVSLPLKIYIGILLVLIFLRPMFEHLASVLQGMLTSLVGLF